LKLKQQLPRTISHHQTSQFQDIPRNKKEIEVVKYLHQVALSMAEEKCQDTKEAKIKAIFILRKI
jgi:hypothetical protein